MRRKESILTCDYCETEKSDGGEDWIGANPHSGWLHLKELGGSGQIGILTQNTNWEFCCLDCLHNFVRNMQERLKEENQKRSHEENRFNKCDFGHR